MDSSLISKAEEYINFDPNSETCSYITNLLNDAISINDNNHATVVELKKLLTTRMAFGTAGLRGPMGAGYCRMNDIVIMQTMQGLIRYLDSQFGEEAKSMGVLIGYDHRRLNSLSSLGFSRMCTAVLTSQGYKAYCLEGFVPTPFVAFGVTHLTCAAGIMITASHNPKADNGFKVYWANGSQIIPPHDAGIANAISNNLAPWHRYDTEGAMNSPLVSDVTSKIADAYYESIASLSDNQANNNSNSVKIVYTAMHGVGGQWVKRAFEVFNHPTLVPVPCQQEADPEFSTVVFPNPEEKGALDKSMDFADEVNASVIIGI
jgi:phosphomannomutase